MFTESVLIKLPFGPFALGQQSSVVKISLDNPRRRINKEPGAKQITIDKYVSIFPHTAGWGSGGNITHYWLILLLVDQICSELSAIDITSSIKYAQGRLGLKTVYLAVKRELRCWGRIWIILAWNVSLNLDTLDMQTSLDSSCSRTRQINKTVDNDWRLTIQSRRGKRS